MSFSPENGLTYPIVNCDLSDVEGTPGLPSPPALAHRLSTPERSWRSHTRSSLFLTTAVPGDGAFAPFEDDLAAASGTDRVQRTFSSAAGRQTSRQQLLDGVPVVGARFRTVVSGTSSTVLGTPVADLQQRLPGKVPRVARPRVVAAVLGQLGLPEGTRVGVERVIFPLEGRGVWAFRAKVVDPAQPADIRAYVRADDLSLLYAQDVSCAASEVQFGEGRVFVPNPGRVPAPTNVRLSGIAGRQRSLTARQLKVVPAAGKVLNRSNWDFRVDTVAAEFDQVCAFHHMSVAAQFFLDILGPDLFTDEPFLPLVVRVQDRSVRSQVGVFLPGQASIAMADGGFPAARSGDICVHEFTHAAVHRVARLDDEFASPIARGLNEGFGDYAQASLYDDPRFGDWVRQQPDGARRCDSDARLPEKPSASLADRYLVGTAWASLLWDLRSEVGPGIADAIAFHSLQYLVPSCDYAAARQALHHADRALFAARRAGRHRTDIDRVFDRRLG